jgi:hypothetical protein
VARRSIVSRKALERLYPSVDVGDFKPTHWLELVDMRTRKVLREDAVVLGAPEGPNKIRYACTPRGSEPTYALVPPNRWQCLEAHGMVRAQPVKYVPDYVRPSDRVGYVYFMQSTGPARSIKIGWSQYLDNRRASLQTANAHKLVIIGIMEGRMEDEAALHARFAYLRTGGGKEWFQNSSEIHAFIAENATVPIDPPV